MKHLVKLELKKHSLRGALYTFVIASLAIFGFVLMVGNTDGEEAFTGYANAFSVIEFLTNATYVVFASVLLSRFVVEEYRSNTITILFTYPINRKKLMLAKLLIVCAVTFVLIVLTNVLVSAGFYWYNEQWPIFTDELTNELVASQALRLVVHAAANTGLALIPLYFGMRKKSVPATIVSSIIIAVLLNAGNNGSTLGSIIAVPVALGVIGILVAYFTIRRVEHVDV
ncbi:ABC transporter permease [Cohnella caldifontis]|uniref:ABC transporter permease n=1 Tax=Cohnella caldifontis TaxID=3027471 RepID=UPI0023EDBF49|nr:ABC transporter permease [Cohnella sp. YIM B05605]